MDPMQIQTLAGKCVTLFKAHIAAYVDAENGFSEEEKEILETQNARFNLWADNIGVFAEGNASLDARLQEHEDIAALVVGQLLSIQQHLGRLETYQSSRDDQEEIQSAENTDEGDATPGASESSFSARTSDVASSQESSSGSVEDVDIEDASPLTAIVHAIHRLHRAAMAIRRSGATSHNLKATLEQFYNDEGMNVIDIFETWCKQLLRHKFKNVDESILQRLAHTNAERRRKFLYRKKHQRKLMGQRSSAPTVETRQTSRPFRDSSTHPTVDGSVEPRERREEHSVTQRSIAQSQTTASKITRDAFIYNASLPSTLTAPSSQLRFKNDMCPPAPKVPTGAAEFYCPYCCRIQLAVERSGRRWKQHFLKDLSPFICLVENCHEPHTLFPDRPSWLKHMESHSVKFTCRHHPRPIHFSSEADFDQHILIEHRQISPAYLARLRSFMSSSARLEISSCPICGFIPTSAPVPGQSVATCETAYVELLTHIANDLNYIALFSLAESNDDLSLSSKASRLKLNDETSQATGLTFALDRDMDMMDINDWPNESISHPADDLETEGIVPEGANREDEWSLFFRYRSPYGGHEEDPRLENFVRRYQLEKLLEEGRTADPQLPCHFLPFKPSKDFYGRDRALDRLEANLHPAIARKSLRTMSLTGPAGIGKSTLAMQYCQTFQKQYDVVLWLHADEESKLANDCTKIAIELGFVGRNSAEARDQKHCWQLVKAWLANPLMNLNDPGDCETASWLLVFDHVLDPDLVNDFWPLNCKSGSILITSRKAMPWNMSFCPVLPIEAFNSEESAEFLSRLIKPEEIGGRTIRLGTRAFHSPTQLIFLTRMIRLGRYSLDKFVQASRDDEGKKAILLLHIEDAMNNQTDLSEWALMSLNPKAAALLDVMAMLDPDCIVERMLMLPPDSISIKAYPKNSDEYHEAKAELLSFSFISRNRSTGNINIHRLIQDAARKNMSAQYYRDVFNSCVALINDEWPYQPFTWRHSISRWAKCEELYPHIVRLQYFSARLPTREADVNAAYDYARLTTDVAWYCHERGRFSESEGFCTVALNIALALRGFLEINPNLSTIINVAQIDRTIAEIHYNHGCITSEMNRPQEAIEHQLIFNRMMLNEFGENPGCDMRLAMSFNELGVAYMINNEWNKGEECFKRSVAEMERLDDYEKYKISLPLVNWAACYSLSGRYDEAEVLLLEGLADRVEKYGENDLESFITGRFYHSLGYVKRAQGLEQESFEYFERARDQYKRTLGRGHHRSADVAIALGQHYSRANDEGKAIECYNRALDAYGQRSIYNLERSRGFFKRAKSLQSLGRDAEAQEDEKSCLELYRKVVPNDTRPLCQLSDQDLERLMVFWSR